MFSFPMPVKKVKSLKPRFNRVRVHAGLSSVCLMISHRIDLNFRSRVRTDLRRLYKFDSPQCTKSLFSLRTFLFSLIRRDLKLIVIRSQLLRIAKVQIQIFHLTAPGGATGLS